MDILSSRRRRRFVVASSSDDDDDGGGGDRASQPAAAAAAEAAAAPAAEAILLVEEGEERGPSPFPNPNNPLVISSSDDDEPRHRDAATTLPSSSSSSSSSFSSCSSSFPINRSDTVEERLRLLGLRLRSDYCFDTTAAGGGTGDDADEKARLCFERFLFEDMNRCGAGVLPPDLHSMHNAQLEGPFVLQVDEIVNLSLPLRERYRQANPGLKRCLKLVLSDGVRHVFGLEYRPIKDLDVLSPVGLKVVVRNVLVRHGLLMLVPEVFQVLGGVAEDLELARQRVVLEINKPYRGKRKQESVSLSERASRAAWPSSNRINSNDQVDVLTSDGISPPQGNPLGNNTRNPEAVANLGHFRSGGVHGQEASREELTPEISRSLHEGALPGASNAPGDLGATRSSRLNLSTRDHRPSVSTIHQPSASAVPLATASRRSLLTSNTNFGISANKCPATSSERVGFEECIYSGGGATPEQDLRNTGPFSKPYSSSSSVAHDAEATHMVIEPDQPALLTDAMEVPFTYMTSLQAKWSAKKGSSTSFIRGKIKCFLTGVKAFQFRDRDTFELQVYVDDGSQIFEVIVDHIFVQGMIGNSPRVVSAALASSDGKEIGEMKETMRNFQRFLSNFEGVMIVELNKIDPLPVARKLTQGCLTSDVHLLMSRLVMIVHDALN